MCTWCTARAFGTLRNDGRTEQNGGWFTRPLLTVGVRRALAVPICARVQANAKPFGLGVLVGRCRRGAGQVDVATVARVPCVLALSARRRRDDAEKLRATRLCLWVRACVVVAVTVMACNGAVVLAMAMGSGPASACLCGRLAGSPSGMSASCACVGRVVCSRTTPGAGACESTSASSVSMGAARRPGKQARATRRHEDRQARYQQNG
jgi:hypothetical protein